VTAALALKLTVEERQRLNRRYIASAEAYQQLDSLRNHNGSGHLADDAGMKKTPASAWPIETILPPCSRKCDLVCQHTRFFFRPLWRAVCV
jgi:hypothetical protein